MIQFSCPSCAAVFSVGDEKAGKTGKCPKCEAKFVIPEAEPKAAPPPPPPSAPADDNVEIKPCPGCQAKLTVARSDLGLDVECPYCKTVYKAAKSGGSSAVIRTDRPSKRSAPVEDDEDDRPRRRSRRDDDDDDDDDRPRKRSRRDDEDDDEDERPRRRSRRDDDDYDRPRRRRSRRVDTSATKAPGIFLLIVGILGLIAGVFYVLQAAGVVGVGRNNALPNNAMAGPAMLLIAITGPIWGLVITLGGFNMINLKSRGSCMVACIFAFIPCNICCLLGIPAGIWGLIVLSRDDVKRAFDS